MRAGKEQNQTAVDVGIHPVTLSKWLRQDDIDNGRRPGTSCFGGRASYVPVGDVADRAVPGRAEEERAGVQQADEVVPRLGLHPVQRGGVGTETAPPRIAAERTKHPGLDHLPMGTRRAAPEGRYVAGPFGEHVQLRGQRLRPVPHLLAPRARPDRRVEHTAHPLPRRPVHSAD
ncbi:hypothetical protein [Streptomyces sp. NPDC058434]|uniref:hypothetical protein n=1 Tax=Streptomyces sp. NPDC058434 TaxID=3346498 RepID=UPI003646A75A